MHATKKKPTELVLSEVSSIPMMKYVTGNNEGRLTTVKQAYNLNQEAKLAERRKNGMFSQEEIVNVFLSIEQTEKKDQQARKDANIVSDLLLGIVRRIEFKPTFNLYFHSRSSLIFMAYLAMSGKLILAEDATGEQFDLPGTKYEGKIQHTKMTIHASESLLSNEDGKEWSRDLFRPYRFAERVSDVNTASEYANWAIQIRNDTKLVTAERFGTAVKYRY